MWSGTELCHECSSHQWHSSGKKFWCRRALSEEQAHTKHWISDIWALDSYLAVQWLFYSSLQIGDWEVIPLDPPSPVWDLFFAQLLLFYNSHKMDTSRLVDSCRCGRNCPEVAGMSTKGCVQQWHSHCTYTVKQTGASRTVWNKIQLSIAAVQQRNDESMDYQEHMRALPKQSSQWLVFLCARLMVLGTVTALRRRNSPVGQLSVSHQF